ncbi:class I SAM-dependent methyltransferase [Nonomuraea angiospora]|uniref:class I SAM-dependent methyltransferase n=1 Tax=Nonomuraea angiospora TaxID=46172 RepID=UPI00344B2004
MHDSRPSRTAIMAAARAAHLVVDSEPYILRDTLAAPMLGDQTEEMIGYHRAPGHNLVLCGTRAQATARGHYAECRANALIGDGLEQYVISGPGSTPFACRPQPMGTVPGRRRPLAPSRARRRRSVKRRPDPPAHRVPLGFHDSWLPNP